MTDRVVLVTGAARRIGAACVRRLHAEGCRVVVHARRSLAEAGALCAELNDRRADSALALEADLSRVEDIRGLVERATARWGRLDGLVNNASLFQPTALADVSAQDWDTLMGVNLRAPFFLCQAAAPQLRAGRGAIVNLVDVYAHRPHPGYSVYGIAKAGLVALTRALARELAPEVRVNAVAPGAILWPADATTDDQAEVLARVPFGRAGAPEDIAGAVLFLLRDAGYVTGQVLDVDGGRTLFI